MSRLGEEGTEQFRVVTEVDGVIVQFQKVHDPFANTTILLVKSRWQSFQGIFSKRHRTAKIEVSVGGTRAALRRITALDPVEMERENRACPRCGKPDGQVFGHDCPNAQETMEFAASIRANTDRWAA
jgi:hypothetical protein